MLLYISPNIVSGFSFTRTLEPIGCHPIPVRIQPFHLVLFRPIFFNSLWKDLEKFCLTAKPNPVLPRPSKRLFSLAIINFRITHI